MKTSLLTHVSTLSAIAGCIETFFENDAGVVWATPSGDWWLRLFFKEDGYFIHMDDRYADPMKMITVAGYIQHCAEDIQYTIGEWEEFMDGFQKAVAH